MKLKMYDSTVDSDKCCKSTLKMRTSKMDMIRRLISVGVILQLLGNIGK
jgi:hypothetical protein